MAVTSTILMTEVRLYPLSAKLTNEKKTLDRRPQNFGLMR
jgi:hypothetical protein